MSTSRTARRLSTGAAALALALTLAACGGGEDGSEDSSTEDGSSAVSSPEDGADARSDGGEAPSDGTGETSTDGAAGAGDGAEATSSGNDPVAGDPVTDLPESVIIQIMHIVSAGETPAIDVITVQSGSITTMSGDPTAEGPDSHETIELSDEEWASLRDEIAELGLTTPEGQAEDLMTDPESIDEIEGQYDWEILAVEGTQPRSLGWDSGDAAQDQALWDLLSSYAE